MLIYILMVMNSKEAAVLKVIISALAAVRATGDVETATVALRRERRFRDELAKIEAELAQQPQEETPA